MGILGGEVKEVQGNDAGDQILVYLSYAVLELLLSSLLLLERWKFMK